MYVNLCLCLCVVVLSRCAYLYVGLLCCRLGVHRVRFLYMHVVVSNMFFLYVDILCLNMVCVCVQVCMCLYGCACVVCMWGNVLCLSCVA